MSPDVMSPGSPMVNMPPMGAGKAATTRKCANCGQAGHIRMFTWILFFVIATNLKATGTNKKLCPKLNGQWKELGMSPPAAMGTPNA